jgi:hypothetical protein
MSENQINLIIQALVSSLEYIESESDVVDGDYGEPRPNAAMQVCSLLKEALDAMGIH